MSDKGLLSVHVLITALPAYRRVPRVVFISLMLESFPRPKSASMRRSFCPMSRFLGLISLWQMFFLAQNSAREFGELYGRYLTKVQDKRRE